MSASRAVLLWLLQYFRRSSTGAHVMMLFQALERQDVTVERTEEMAQILIG